MSTTEIEATSTVTSDLPTGGFPFALIFSFGVIGGLFLLVLILIGITAICFIARNKSPRGRTELRESRQYSREPHNQENITYNHHEKPKTRPLYTKVNKNSSNTGQNDEDVPPPLPPPFTIKEQALPPPPTPDYPPINSRPPSTSCSINNTCLSSNIHSPSNSRGGLPAPPGFSPLHSELEEETRHKQLSVKPHEIITYNLDIPKTFMPHAPPPPISGLASTDNLNMSQNPYDIPLESLADYEELDSSPEHFTRKPSRARSLQSRSYYQSPADARNYYDKVESVDGVDLNSSVTFSLNQSMMSEGHYQSPRRQVQQRILSQPMVKNYRFDADHIYKEPLEPSMLHLSVSSAGSDSPLPYGPIYDTPRNAKRMASQLLEISPHNITEIQDLGSGRFGRVVVAAIENLSLNDLNLGENTDKNRSFLVAVKNLKNNANPELRKSFQDEIDFMSNLKHANVIRLIAVCSLSTSSFMLVEYMENGDLQDFLRKQTLVPDNTKQLQNGEATPLILLYMSVQIASGMQYLASRKFVHRDLATRNCLVGQEFVVKISDFGMSRNLNDSFYYRVKGQLILPIRWMSYESFYGRFSTKSDVWAFGVTLWEIYSMASSDPYGEMSDEDLINDATKGKDRMLLQCPGICPQAVYDIMQRCWVHKPTVRADFEEVYSRLFVAYITKSQEAS